jgi:hypothetical protein
VDFFLLSIVLSVADRSGFSDSTTTMGQITILFIFFISSVALVEGYVYVISCILPYDHDHDGPEKQWKLA